MKVTDSAITTEYFSVKAAEWCIPNPSATPKHVANNRFSPFASVAPAKIVKHGVLSKTNCMHGSRKIEMRNHLPTVYSNRDRTVVMLNNPSTPDAWKKTPW